ncbi:MAG: hypothetical protein ACYC3X_06995 [Pirellulaceae bacterium]
MSIEFACSRCGQILRVGDEAAGKRAKCPQCQSVVPIPAARDSADASSAPAPPPTDWDRLFLFGLVVATGYLLCIVPGIIAMLVWWPCYFLVIDRQTTVMESFGLAGEITANNIGTTFLLWIVSVGISLLGLLCRHHRSRPTRGDAV